MILLSASINHDPFILGSKHHAKIKTAIYSVHIYVALELGKK